MKYFLFEKKTFNELLKEIGIQRILHFGGTNIIFFTCTWSLALSSFALCKSSVILSTMIFPWLSCAVTDSVDTTNPS